MDIADSTALWSGQEARTDVVAVSVHADHGLRKEVAAKIAVPEAVRLREEDGGTAAWAAGFPTRRWPTVPDSR